MGAQGERWFYGDQANRENAEQALYDQGKPTRPTTPEDVLDVARASIPLLARAARLVTTQVIPPATWTTVNFNAVSVDTHSAIITGASWTFTVPPGKGGYYLITTCVTIDAVTDDVGTVSARTVVNGAALDTGGSLVNRGGSTPANVTSLVLLAAGDVVRVECQHGQAADRVLVMERTFVQILRVMLG